MPAGAWDGARFRGPESSGGSVAAGRCEACGAAPEGAGRERRGEAERLEFPAYALAGSREVSRLGHRLERLRGVGRASVNPITCRGVVQYDPASTSLGAIVEALGAEGLDLGDALVRWHLPVRGTRCPACARRLEGAVERLPGVRRATLNPETESLTVELRVGRASPEAVRRAIAEAPGPAMKVS